MRRGVDVGEQGLVLQITSQGGARVGRGCGEPLKLSTVTDLRKDGEGKVRRVGTK